MGYERSTPEWMRNVVVSGFEFWVLSDGAPAAGHWPPPAAG
jgi:hypothetical protein